MRRRDRRQRGSVYILVLGVSLLVTVLGVGALMAMRVERDRSTLDGRAQQARRFAESAIDLALLKINNDAAWRTTYSHDAWTGEQALGDGTIDWKLVDAYDTDLADDDSQRVELVALGKLGDARQLVSVTLEPPTGPALEALDYAVRVAGTLRIMPMKTFAVIGGSGVSADVFDNGGTLIGDVVTALPQLLGLIGGNSAVTADPPASPPADLIDRYIAIATPLAYSGDIDKSVIAPGYNDYGGGTNPDGVYYINTGGNDITIKRSRIQGTLVIDAGGGCVKIDEQVYLENHRPDYPALIIRGNALFTHTRIGQASDRLLRESVHNTNYNPAGAAYLGVADADQADDYPNEIRGLVHVIGDADWFQAGRIRGGLLVEGDLTINHTPEAVYGLDPTTPIWGYTQPIAGAMTIVPGSWRRVVQ